jgi:glycerol-3-phosphate dehydrogenase (NAD(P)+)
MTLDEVYGSEQQTIEGIRTIEAMHHLSLQNHVELPMINVAYDIIFNGLPVAEGLQKLLSRDLKSEDF